MKDDSAQRLDYSISMAVNALIQAMGMLSENLQRIHNGDSIAYDLDAFSRLAEENGIYHNAIIARWESTI